MERQVFEVEEQGFLEVPLSKLSSAGRLDLYPEVLGSDYFRLSLRQGYLALQAGGYVGLIPINDRVAIDVRPRVPIGNLDRLLQVTAYRPAALPPELVTRPYGTRLPSLPSLLDALTSALINALMPVEQDGLYRTYHQVVENTSFPRGRLLATETIRRNVARGLAHRATVTWFSQIIDNAPNRCLKYAIYYLAGRYMHIRPRRKGMLKLISELNRLYHLFDGVALDEARGFLFDPTVAEPSRLPSSRAYYEDALRLAVTIIRDAGVTFDGRSDAILMSSLLIDMDNVFESYVRALLSDGLAALSPEIRVLDGNKTGTSGGRKSLFDPPDLEEVHAKPDVVIRRINGTETHPLLLEVKYKPVLGTPDADDVHQVVAYAVSYRAPMVVLVHPTRVGRPSGLRRLGTIDDITLYVYAFDLSSADLQSEEAAFVQRIRDFL